MERASPIDMRRALDMVDALKEAGILFVPMPVANRDEYNQYLATSLVKLAAMEREATEVEEAQDDKS